MKYDILISHAHEDKESVARPLAERLLRAGLKVWYDEFSLQMGDSLSESIDFGLAQSRFSAVIISKSFLGKPWPKRELRGLISREVLSGRKIVLPVWHEISREEVLAASPPLAEVVAASTSKGLDYVAEQILRVVRVDSFRSTKTDRSMRDYYWEGSKSDERTADLPEPVKVGYDVENKSGKSTHDLSHGSTVAGEYSIDGHDKNGNRYKGYATLREIQGVVIIASRIGSQTHICQGKLDRELSGGTLRVYGDFDVEYKLAADGSLVGIWGGGGVETLMPLHRAQ